MAEIQKLMEHETAGDPMTGLKWTRKTTAKIAKQLKSLGIKVSRNTVGKLLKKMGYSLKTNRKKISNGSRGDRDAQFVYIGDLREQFMKQGRPIVSVDAKKKELIGQFKNPGSTWVQESVPVNDHDFRSLAKGKGIPYGIYDLQANRGSIFLGISHNTAAFAVESIEKWWRNEGRQRYPKTRELYILADNGGGNGSTSRAWKYELQKKVCNRHGLKVTVSHYPPGASKWNPIEHRLFSEISKHWAGRPLDSYETALKYLRRTRTTTGLKVRAQLVIKKYPTGVGILNTQMSELSLHRHDTLPKWNYTLTPNPNANGK